MKVLGSSSSGNGYVLTNGTEALILEAGVRGAEVKRALGFDVSGVAGCLITHEHGDHAGYVNDMLDMAIPVYASQGTIDNVTISGNRRPTPCRAGEILKLGRFTVLPFPTRHDCAEPLGYYIQHPETGNVLFATDTYYLPCKFAGLNNILIECNYSDELLNHSIEEGRLPSVVRMVRKRTVQSHMSYRHCLDTLLANDLRAVNNIVLIHLSAGNSDAEAFRKGIAAASGKRVHIADTGMEIEFNRTPF